MNIFRSEPMDYFKIVIPKDNSVKIMSAIETIGNIHFIDKSENDLKTKNYYSESAKKCGDLIYHFKEIEEKMDEFGIDVKKVADIEDFYTRLEEISHSTKESQEKIFSDLGNELDGVFSRLNESTNQINDLESTIIVIRRRLGFFNLAKQLVPKDNIG